MRCQIKFTFFLKGFYMDNYDVLKFKTYYQYNFDNIESQDFLNLFHSYLKHETVSKDINLNKFESTTGSIYTQIEGACAAKKK